jgi:hypothetical protein
MCGYADERMCKYADVQMCGRAAVPKNIKGVEIFKTTDGTNLLFISTFSF